jgi:hypothetical protein
MPDLRPLPEALSPSRKQASELAAALDRANA